jgi:hypothetical protein
MPNLDTELNRRNRALSQSSGDETGPRYRAQLTTSQNRVNGVTKPKRRKPELREGLSELYSSIDYTSIDTWLLCV